MKYKILFDWHTGGYGFEDEEFETVGKAVKHAFGLGFSPQFLIVQVVDWEALEIKK